MGGITPKPDLGAAVSNAGGLGCIEGIMPADGLREAIQQFRTMSDKPFSINFPLAQGTPEMTAEKVKVCIEEQVPAVITSAGSPKMVTSQLKEGGIKVGHVVASTYHAQKAADAGVDCLIAEPTESGGYRGEHDIAMMVLIPSVRRAVPDIPLAACGSVVDRNGLVAVLALGADGVQLGTRIMVTKEAQGSYGDHVAKLVIAATDTSTMSAEGRIRPRISKPEFAEEVLGTSSKRTQMGMASALINEIISVEDMFKELFEGGPALAKEVAAKLDEIAK
jgi:enoyl-[acyl-carrier protein] reductase II